MVTAVRLITRQTIAGSESTNTRAQLAFLAFEAAGVRLL